jgi:hypothetical protein
MDATLQNVIFYTASSAAQVWAALLVFQILVIRDARRSVDDAIGDLRFMGGSEWNTIVRHLQSRIPQIANSPLKLKLDNEVLETVTILNRSFQWFVHTVSSSKLLHHEAAYGPNQKEWGETYQAKIDKVADKLAEMEVSEAKPELVYKVGIVAILLNFVAILSAKFSDPCGLLLWAAAILILAVNVGLLSWVSLHMYSVVKTPQAKA